jgi:hypothetical protein
VDADSTVRHEPWEAELTRTIPRSVPVARLRGVALRCRSGGANRRGTVHAGATLANVLKALLAPKHVDPLDWAP